MQTPSPAQVNHRRTARLVSEGAHRPRVAYSSTTGECRECFRTDGRHETWCDKTR